MPKTNNKNEKPESAALQTMKECPSCGRKDAVVFPVYLTADGKPSEKPRMVCFACHPITQPGSSSPN